MTVDRSVVNEIFCGGWMARLAEIWETAVEMWPAPWSAFEVHVCADGADAEEVMCMYEGFVGQGYEVEWDASHG